jgi:hypothetical protein
VLRCNCICVHFSHHLFQTENFTTIHIFIDTNDNNDDNNNDEKLTKRRALRRENKQNLAAHLSLFYTHTQHVLALPPRLHPA